MDLYPKMKILSCYKLLLILIIQLILCIEEIRNINEGSSIYICKGNDVDLLWKVDEEENKISKLEWYFQNKIICSSSSENVLTVSTPYQGRIEMIDKTGIRLKNVSQDDEGTYILFPLKEWSTSQNMEKIVLHILEPPTDKCRCKRSDTPEFEYELPATDCGRPRVSFVLKRNQIIEGLEEENWIINSKLQGEGILCCLGGEAMKCINDSRQFCTNVSIPHQHNVTSEMENTQQRDSVTVPGFMYRDNGCTNPNNIQPYNLAILTVCSLILIINMAFIIIYCRKRKKKKNIDPRLQIPKNISMKQPRSDSEADIELQPL